MLGSAPWLQVASDALAHPDQSLTFDQPVDSLPVVDDARWSAALTDHSLVALLFWIVLLLVLHAVAWPLVRGIFTRFPDRGWSFTRLVSLLGAGYAIWLLASLEVIAFRAVWCGGALLVLGLAGWGLRARLGSRADAEPWWRNRVIVGSETVFWVVFALFLLFRALNPDSYHPYWGGEKPMEFAHLNAILRSAHFPPVDPWYSGGYINYYYYGTYLVAFLTKLTGIPAEIAFNLALPTFLALLAGGVFGGSAALGHRLSGSTTGAIVAGALGTFFVSIAGNLIAAARLVERALNGLAPVDPFSWWVWGPSRAIPRPEDNINITEFPYFSGLYGDLHPHVLAMPITVLMIGVAWPRATVLVLARPGRHRGDVARIAALLVVAALGLGTLFMANAWDLPTYAAVIVVGVVMATRCVAGPRRFAATALALALIGVLAYTLTLPFTSHYVALFREIGVVRDRTPVLAVESHLGGQILLLTVGLLALVGGRRLPPAIPGGVALPLLALGIFLAMQWVGRDEDGMLVRLGEAGAVLLVVAAWIIGAWWAADRPGDFGVPPGVLRSLLLASMLAAAILVIADRGVLGLYLGTGLAAAVLWCVLSSQAARMVAALAAGGMLIGAALEIVYLVDDLNGDRWYRMNTIFKFYNQIWVLLGIATAVLVGRAAWESWQGSWTDEPRNATNGRGWARGTTGLAGLVMVAALAYPVMATPVRLRQDFPQAGRTLTLDAYNWMRYGQIQFSDGEWVGYADDLAAIAWLNEHVDGTPVIAEASFGPYRCNGSRFSIATGLPAVIGWVRHEMQQRYHADLAQREQDVRTLYTSPDIATKQAIIGRYGIDYIIVGETERKYPRIEGGCVDGGSEAGIAELEAMVGSQLEIAYRHGGTTVYRVLEGTPR